MLLDELYETLANLNERRLDTITETIETTSDNGSQNDIAKMARLKAKQSEYRTFIAELSKAQRRADEAEQQEENAKESSSGIIHTLIKNHE